MAILQLDRHLINKIAAGEVVERPLSVVKELTENAIDAGAGQVIVEIREGGLASIRVTDNGGGISPEDLPLAFARHATSKIASFDDLMQVATLGFRGEALSSISAVSQVEMITKTISAQVGTHVEVHGGQLVSSKEIGCADGTTVIVSNLFYNTPARRKFLKKPATEAGLIAHCLERLALGNTRLVFRYINNGQIVFQTTGNGDLKTAMLAVYGREVATKTAKVQAEVQLSFGEARLEGLVGKPETARGNRRHGNFFVNGRLVESKLVTRAIESAMRTMLPSGKFPVYALCLHMPHDALDVNVHPTKMDVRFADEEAVFAFIEDAVRDALEEHNLVPTVRLGDNRLRRAIMHGDNAAQAEGVEQLELPEPRLAEPRLINRGHETVMRAIYGQKATASNISHLPPLHDSSVWEGDIHTNKPAFTPATASGLNIEPLYGIEPLTARTNDVYPIESPTPDIKKFFTHYQIHGLIFQTYWLVSQGESLFMIDQHAAHERILYEDFLKKARREVVHGQQLLAPIPLRLTPREQQLLHDNAEIFTRFGFEIERTNIGNTPLILAVPFLMKGPLSAEFFTDLLDKMDEAGFEKDNAYTHKTELVAMAACKAAVKAGDNINEAEARGLIERLLALDAPFTCPHGRPTIIEITRREIERRFKR